MAQIVIEQQVSPSGARIPTACSGQHALYFKCCACVLNLYIYQNSIHTNYLLYIQRLILRRLRKNNEISDF